MSHTASYFVRHTNILAIAPDTVSLLHSENLVAIHYPDLDEADPKATDLASLNPKDYKSKKQGNAVGKLVELATNGGYLWADYYTQPTAKIGRILPGTPIEFRQEKWDNPKYPNRRGLPAILKTLRMVDVREVAPYEMQALRAIRPPHAALSAWPSANILLQAAALRQRVELTWANLSPAQQEIAFSEFLRTHDIPGLPRLKMLLMPPGRTLEDIDMYGVAADGKKIFAQVTFSKVKDVKGKVSRLRAFAGNGNHLLFLGQANEISDENGVTIIPAITLDAWLRSNRPWTANLVEEIASN